MAHLRQLTLFCIFFGLIAVVAAQNTFAALWDITPLFSEDPSHFGNNIRLDVVGKKQAALQTWSYLEATSFNPFRNARVAAQTSSFDGKYLRMQGEAYQQGNPDRFYVVGLEIDPSTLYVNNNQYFLSASVHLEYRDRRDMYPTNILRDEANYQGVIEVDHPSINLDKLIRDLQLFGVPKETIAKLSIDQSRPIRVLENRGEHPWKGNKSPSAQAKIRVGTLKETHRLLYAAKMDKEDRFNPLDSVEIWIPYSMKIPASAREDYFLSNPDEASQVIVVEVTKNEERIQRTPIYFAYESDKTEPTDSETYLSHLFRAELHYQSSIFNAAKSKIDVVTLKLKGPATLIKNGEDATDSTLRRVWADGGVLTVSPQSTIAFHEASTEDQYFVIDEKASDFDSIFGMHAADLVTLPSLGTAKTIEKFRIKNVKKGRTFIIDKYWDSSSQLSTPSTLLEKLRDVMDEETVQKIVRDADFFLRKYVTEVEDHLDVHNKMSIRLEGQIITDQFGKNAVVLKARPHPQSLEESRATVEESWLTKTPSAVFAFNSKGDLIDKEGKNLIQGSSCSFILSRVGKPSIAY
ncbi:MAG: hypothetical protein J0L93_05800 [Deltaproteobacteria bacterium]|nr:hypothetical protein [Deltaproteobacteria bacterium]